MLRAIALLTLLCVVATPAVPADPPPIQDLVTVAGAAPKEMAERARAALARIEDGKKVPALMKTALAGPEKLRLYSVQELTRIEDRRALPVLLVGSLRDSSRRVREAALGGVKAIDRDLGVRYYVHRIEAHGGNAARSHVQIATQTSFIQDYDVEVASTAFIADPIVSLISEGSVLDVKVVATSRQAIAVTRDRIHRTLRELTGATTVKNRRGAWRKWLRSQGKTTGISPGTSRP